jgi:cGMP-dependent protein kinase
MVDRMAALRNALVLQQLPEEELAQLAEMVKPVELRAGEILAVRGQPSRGLVIVDSGSLEVLLDASPLCTLAPGSVFGEDALCTDGPAQATLRAAVPSRVHLLERREVAQRLAELPASTAALEIAWRQRVLVARLYGIDLFRNISDEARQRLADHFELIDLPPGAVLAEEGAEADAFYVIRSGEARLHLGPGQEPSEVPLKIADYLGDWSVIEDAPHTARVTAPDGVRVLRLDREAFYAALEGKPDDLAEINAAAARRKESLF